MRGISTRLRNEQMFIYLHDYYNSIILIISPFCWPYLYSESKARHWLSPHFVIISSEQSTYCTYSQHLPVHVKGVSRNFKRSLKSSISSRKSYCKSGLSLTLVRSASVECILKGLRYLSVEIELNLNSMCQLKCGIKSNILRLFPAGTLFFNY